MKRIALLIDTTTALNRRIIKGVARYARRKNEWDLQFELVDLHTIPEWKLKGAAAVIARPRTLEQADLVNQMDCLKFTFLAAATWKINQGTIIRLPDFDMNHAVRMALDHLLERGLEHFVFVSHPMMGSMDRDKPFNEYLQKKGCTASIYHWPTMQNNSEFKSEAIDDLADYLKKCPKPLGVMGANDVAARHAVDACKRAGLAVPEEVGVIGIDNDEFVCELCTPPLSSVIAPGEQMGYLGAWMVDRYLARKPVHNTGWIKPRHVAVRMSTDIVGVSDPQVAMAVRHIRNHANEGLSINELAEKVGLSRRTLEMRMAKLLHTSPAVEIERVRIQQACTMIQKGGMLLKQVASSCGYPNHFRFKEAFERVMGMTPSLYQKKWSNRVGV